MRLLQIPGYLLEIVGKSVWRIRPNAFYTGLTGSAVLVNFNIDHPHRLVRLEVHHTDAAKDDSTDNLDLSFSRQQEGGNIVQKLYENTAIIVANVNVLFGEGYEMPSSQYTLSADSTNTDRLYWELYAQLLGD